MTEQDKEQLNIEISYIFESGANHLRIFEMVENFIDKRYKAINYTLCCKSDSELLNVSKTNPNFEEWLQTHEKFKDNSYVWGMGYVMSYADMKAKHKELIELNI